MFTLSPFDNSWEATLSGPLFSLLERCPDSPISNAIQRIRYNKDTKEWTLGLHHRSFPRTDPLVAVQWLLDCGLKVHSIDAQTISFKDDVDDGNKVLKFFRDKCDKLQDDDTADFTLESCDGTQFKVHKYMLMRSSTFSRVLSGQGAEFAQRYPDLAQGKLRFGEASGETVHAFIRNLYCDTATRLARLEIARDFNPGHAQFWSDGQRRRTPALWMINGTNTNDMHLNDAAKLLLSHQENTRIVSARLGGQVDMVEIEFCDFSVEAHENRKSMGRQYFPSTHRNHIQGTKSIPITTSCNVEVVYRHHRTDMPIILENGRYVPARVLLIRMCTYKECEERHAEQLHDLDECEIYPNVPMGLPVHVYSSCTGRFLAECLAASLRYIGFQCRMIEKCSLIGFGDYHQVLRSLNGIPWNWSQAQFARLFEAGMVHINPTVRDAPSNLRDQYCYRCSSDRFGSDNFAPGFNNVFEEAGKHRPENFEGVKNPVGDAPPWYNRRVNFNVNE